MNRKKLLETIRKHILNCEHYGHRGYCAAIKGPDGENWYEDENCNCSRREALEALDALSTIN